MGVPRGSWRIESSNIRGLTSGLESQISLICSRFLPQFPQM